MVTYLRIILYRIDPQNWHSSWNEYHLLAIPEWIAKLQNSQPHCHHAIMFFVWLSMSYQSMSLSISPYIQSGGKQRWSRHIWDNRLLFSTLHCIAEWKKKRNTKERQGKKNDKKEKRKEKKKGIHIRKLLKERLSRQKKAYLTRAVGRWQTGPIEFEWV